MSEPLKRFDYNAENELAGTNRFLVPFMACGDLNGLDADQNYALLVVCD